MMRRRSARKTQRRNPKQRKAPHQRSAAPQNNDATVAKNGVRASQSGLSSRGLRRFIGQQDGQDVARWLGSPGSSRALMDLAHDTIIIRDPASRVESWNASAARLYGWSAKEAVGQITHTLLDTKFPSSKEAVDATLLHEGYWEGELRHRRKDGTQIVVESRQSLLRDANGKPLLIKEINRDITQQRRQLNYLRLLNEVSASVGEARTVDEALRWLLASICLQTNWCAARASMVNRNDSSGAVSNPVWFLNDENRLRAFRDAIDGKSRIPHVERVFRKCEPVWIPDIRKDSYFGKIPQLATSRLRCAYVFPIPLGSEGVAIVLFSDAPVELDEAFISTMNGVGRHLSRLFERLGAEGAQRALSVSLMRAQDDERRRVARELHDSAGQYLSALTLALDAARSHGDAVPPAALRKLEEASEIINRCSVEIRTLSHLLHPPLLEELGLTSAVNWYVEGFAERSGLKVEMQLPAQVGRFDPSVELTLFRALQECLTNIHRHSGSKTASVRIEAHDRQLTLEVCDEGKGIEKEMLGNWFGNRKRSGVGITGMRERVKDLGGTLEIESSSAGTVVRATIPLRERIAGSDAEQGKDRSVSVGTSD
jgi:PAS domain S-box-containing protein